MIKKRAGITIIRKSKYLSRKNFKLVQKILYPTINSRKKYAAGFLQYRRKIIRMGSAFQKLYDQ